jgi:hypothetical protein
MRILVNLSLVAVSLVLSTLAAELVIRSARDPIDYLLPELISDDFLFHRVEGYTGGHDAWGFRNPRKPDTADIVCIGDSMTYGISAMAHDSWPAVLGRIRSTSVYNMSLGGYGPIQYLYLMRTKAVQLHPKIVIVGFYFGNDFFDVYNEVRFNKNWSAVYGKLGDYSDKPPGFGLPSSGKFLGGLRDWLSKHSVLYALVTRASLFDFVRRREIAAGNDANIITYHDYKHNEIFNLNNTVRFLDMADPRIKSAMEITKQVMLDMNRLAEKEKFRLIVALIPTKERVYGKILDHAGYFAKYPQLAYMVHQEDLARDEIARFLHEANIEIVDLFPELESEINNHDAYSLTDPHPNKDGYHVIAETINYYLNTH